MPLNEYRYLKKTDKGQHINLATGKSKEKKKVDDDAFDAMTAVSDMTSVDVIKKGKASNTKGIHTALLAAGMTPAYGNIADVADATLYALEGEFGEAAWSMAAAIPIVGQMVAGRRAAKVAKEAGEEMVTLYRAVGKGGVKAKGGKFIGSSDMKGEIYATLDFRVSKKYASLNPDRVVMEFEVPKKWLIENEETIQMAIREGDTFMANLRKQTFDKAISGKTSLGKEVRFSKEVGIPEIFLKKVHK